MNKKKQESTAAKPATDTNATPAISIIMPNRNYAKYIDDALNSARVLF